MLKAVLALVLTIFLGWCGAAYGNDLMGGWTGFGNIIATAVMGAFIIYFNEKKK